MRTLSQLHIDKKTWLYLGCVLAIILIVFSPSLKNDFVWDDFDFIVNWPALRQFPSTIPKLLQGHLPESHDHAYRPLRSLYYGLSFMVWELNPSGYHFQAILIHGVAAMAVFCVIRYLTSSPVWAALGALWFGLHPSNTEAVYWITASFDTIGNALFLIALGCYVAFRRESNTRWYWLSVIVATLAFFSYELTLTLPAILYVYDILVYRNKKAITWKTYLPFLIPNAGYWFMRFVVLHLSSDKPPVFAELSANIMMLVILLGKYITTALGNISPTVNHQLRSDITSFYYADYNFHQPPSLPQLSDSDVLLSLGLTGGILILGWRSRKKWPYLSFVLAGFMISLIPVSQLFPRAIIFSERYLYLGIGLISIFGTYLLSQNFKKYQPLIISGFLIVIGLFARTSYRRAFDWQDNISLWTSATQTTPESMTMYRNLGDAYHKATNYQQAIEASTQALAINPNAYPVYANLAASYVALEQFDQAIELYTKVTEMNPNDAYAFIKLGDIYLVQNQPEVAEQYYLKASYRGGIYADYISQKLKEVSALKQ